MCPHCGNRSAVELEIKGIATKFTFPGQRQPIDVNKQVDKLMICSACGMVYADRATMESIQRIQMI